MLSGFGALDVKGGALRCAPFLTGKLVRLEPSFWNWVCVCLTLQPVEQSDHYPDSHIPQTRARRCFHCQTKVNGAVERADVGGLGTAIFETHFAVG